jgi:LysR family transcriptional regulator, hydrogen peroxide-inducible genes activator
MDLRQLEYFAAIARTGSVTAAARRCKVSQPTLSQQLRALEDELGEPLVHRQPRGVTPTAAGRLLLEHAEPVLDGMRRLHEQFDRRRKTDTGQIRFGMIPTLAPYLLPRLLRPYRQTFPNVDVQVSEGRTASLIGQVVDGTLEFAILSDVTPQERRKGSLHVTELFREPLMLAVPADHPLARDEEPPRPQGLAPETLIHLRDGHCLTERTLKICRLNRLDPGLECDQLETALAMVAAGMGMAVIPQLATSGRSPAGVALRSFAAPEPERTINLMKRRGATLSKPAKELLHLLNRLRIR